MSAMSLTTETGVKNSPPFCRVRGAKIAQEVLVNAPEDVVGVHGNGAKGLQQACQGGGLETPVGLGQDVLFGFSASIAFMASLRCLPMSSPSVRSSNF